MTCRLSLLLLPSLASGRHPEQYPVPSWSNTLGRWSSAPKWATGQPLDRCVGHAETGL